MAESLMQRPGEVVSREALLESLWDDVDFVDDNTLTVNVTRLRKKLESLGLPKAIETVRGIGYKLAMTNLSDGASK
ncbi:Response regulator protein GraR [compost metagenome]